MLHSKMCILALTVIILNENYKFIQIHSLDPEIVISSGIIFNKI